tara:strand:- start:466 stop:1353 length:888 start_codon:yes stop_codon:yes gene_type:complete
MRTLNLKTSTQLITKAFTTPTLIFFSFCYLLVSASATAQAPVTIADTLQIDMQSAINGQLYTLQVSLPYQYEKSAVDYPVIYLLDANNDFPLVTSIARRLQAEDDMQEFFIVGIGYPEKHWEHRRRDYTPTHAQPLKNSGGGPDFTKVLETEILPLIDAKFRTKNGSRSLLGHSLGGLFGAHLLINDSKLFDSYIISSPSIWWNNYAVLKNKPTKSLQHPAAVFLTVGSDEGNNMITSWDQLHDFVKQDASIAASKAVSLAGENHASAKFRAYADGLRWLFGKDVQNKRLTKNTR